MRSILLLTLLVTGAGAAPISFNEQIRPILNKNCTSCHGGVKQAAEVSFIYRDQALGKGESGLPIVVPGDPGASEMIRRITTTDLDERMPPAKEHPEGLSADEVALLKDWVAQGAPWEEQWSFVPPRPHPLPEVHDGAPVKQPLDRFILARLAEENLAPSPAAPPAQWLRRVTFDLTGLPPTLDELRSFEAALETANDRETVYHATVDRLLAAPAYGERWASLWLDLARYADTQGYEKDRHRDIWAYRDWVIEAFNSDLPYSEFTIKQLAGDLLPEPALDDLVATAFHRNTQTNTEGGTDDEEFRVAAVLDRVNTTWTVWQGMTFGCVQCHSHPYDAFRHEEYYQSMAFFNNTEDYDLNDDFPTIRVPGDHAQHARCVELDHRIADLREEINAPGRELEVHTRWEPLLIEDLTGADSVRFSINGNEARVDGTVPFGSSYDATTPGRSFTALRVELRPTTEDPTQLPEHGSVLSHFTAEVVPPDGQPRAIPFEAVYAQTLSGPFDPEDSLREGGSGAGAHPKIDRPLWFTFVPAAAVEVPEGAKLHLRLTQSIRSAETKGSVIKRFALATSNDPAWTRVVNAPERAALRQEWRTAREERKKFGGTGVPVLAERPAGHERETRVFVRGNFLSKGEVVAPGTPASLPPISSASGPGAQPTRLDFARWIASESNPLTARVLVNRIWGELFGIGLVETVEDFGSTGTPPMHPALLDHLALRFMNEHEWRLKALLRELVLSATYRRDHRVSAAQLAADPHNRLLARGPRTRLTAEMIRDQALRASGLLTEKVGGPSVMPPQPDGVWSVVYSGAKWVTPDGPDRYRRGLYTYWRRTSPYPSFLTFDASSREVCLPRRISTNTPLQALVTLNDPVFLECAQALARRVRSGSPPDRSATLQALYLSGTTQQASPTILRHLLALYEDAVDYYTANEEERKHLGDTVEDAALVLLANSVLNLDAALTK